MVGMVAFAFRQMSPVTDGGMLRGRGHSANKVPNRALALISNGWRASRIRLLLTARGMDGVVDIRKYLGPVEV